jgi:hypothetical protein
VNPVERTTDLAVDLASSAAATHVVTDVRACVRHAGYDATGACASCAAPLCRACIIHAAHQRCGACREAKGDAATVLDAAWRVSLMWDGVSSTVRALPKRIPAIALVTAVSLALALFGTERTPTAELDELVGPLVPELAAHAPGAAVDEAPEEAAEEPAAGLDEDEDLIEDRLEARWLARVAPVGACLDGNEHLELDERRRLRAQAREEGCVWQPTWDPKEVDDSDGDGLLDKHEGLGDENGDGVPDFADPVPARAAHPHRRADPDRDGLSTQQELIAGTSPFSPDSDADGFPDVVEAPRGVRIDSDGDGHVDGQDFDSDGDGVADDEEGLLVEREYSNGDTDGAAAREPSLDDKWTIHDVDGDGTPDRLDRDDDGDGIPTRVEIDAARSNVYGTYQDHDEDGLPNALDLDSDDDGEPDGVEGNLDRDGDGEPDFLDGEIAFERAQQKSFEARAMQSYAGFAWLFALFALPFLAMPRATWLSRVKGALFGAALWGGGGALVALVVRGTDGEAWGPIAVLLLFIAYVPWLLGAQALVVDGAPLMRALRDAARRPLGTMAMHCTLAGTVAVGLALVASGLGIAAAALTALVLGNAHDDAVLPFALTFAVSVLATLWLVAVSGYARGAARFAQDAARVDV